MDKIFSKILSIVHIHVFHFSFITRAENARWNKETEAESRLRSKLFAYHGRCPFPPPRQFLEFLREGRTNKSREQMGGMEFAAEKHESEETEEPAEETFAIIVIYDRVENVANLVEAIALCRICCSSNGTAINIAFWLIIDYLFIVIVWKIYEKKYIYIQVKLLLFGIYLILIPFLLFEIG